MTTQTRAQQLKEIEFQTQMLNNLKKWIRNLIILSSIGIIIATNLGLTFLIFFPFLCRKKDDLTIIVLFHSKNGFAISLFYLLSESYLRIGD